SCLTGAIRPQQTDNLPLLHINGHMAHYRTLSVLFHQILRTQHHATFLPWLCPGSQAWSGLQIFLNFLYIVLYAFFFFHTLKVFAANVAKISRNSVHLHSNTYMSCLKHLRQ